MSYTKTVTDIVSDCVTKIMSISIDPDDGSVEITIVKKNLNTLMVHPSPMPVDEVIVQRWNADGGKLVLSSERTGRLELTPSSHKIVMNDEE